MKRATTTQLNSNTVKIHISAEYKYILYNLAHLHLDPYFIYPLSLSSLYPESIFFHPEENGYIYYRWIKRIYSCTFFWTEPSFSLPASIYYVKSELMWGPINIDTFILSFYFLKFPFSSSGCFCVWMCKKRNILYTDDVTKICVVVVWKNRTDVVCENVYLKCIKNKHTLCNVICIVHTFPAEHSTTLFFLVRKHWNWLSNLTQIPSRIGDVRYLNNFLFFSRIE